MSEVNLELIKQARELQEWFLGTYAEHVLEDAIKSGNNELIRVVVKEYGGMRQLAEESEEQPL